jgi:hypothetical protein
MAFFGEVENPRNEWIEAKRSDNFREKSTVVVTRPADTAVRWTRIENFVCHQYSRSLLCESDLEEQTSDRQEINP